MLNDEICGKCYDCEWFVGGECDGRVNSCGEYEPVNIDGREGW